MIPPASTLPSGLPPSRRADGFVLPIVLLCVVLLTVLIVAFLSSVTTDQAASTSYARTTESRSLANTAVNLVIAQIQQGARSTAADGTPQSWSSQPGLIRTYSGAGAGPSYKLYSATSLVSPAALDPTTDLPPSDWLTSPALFTDLNAPVKRSNGLSANAADITTYYPILNPPPTGTDPNAVPGYSILSDSTWNPQSVTAPVMPVRWMYMLKNGDIASATGTGKAAKVDGASKTNPITGRIAFWTDDETCKININTAGGDEWNGASATKPGSFWDLPRFDTNEENSLMASQPVQHEYQRFPGHPGSVYLSAAFPTLTREQIYQLAPRIEPGGSQGGTVVNGAAATTTAISLDADRLYTSVDELMFTSPARDPRKAWLTRDMLEKAKFFLTANSRAPEVNLFGLPRIAMWPVYYKTSGDLSPSSDYTTPFDRMVAYCASLRTSPGANGTIPFYVQRKNSKSTTDDFSGITRNQDLYSYLQSLTSLNEPGFGGNFFSKYSDDRDQILTEAFDYIRCTNIFDDLLVKQSKKNYPLSSGYPTGDFTYTAKKEQSGGTANPDRSDPAHGQVTPLVMTSNQTKGFGRFSTVSEAGMIFICTADGDTDDWKTSGLPDALARQGYAIESNGPTNKTLAGLTLADTTRQRVLSETQRRVEAMFVIELFCPSQGYPLLNYDMQIQVSGLNGFSLDGNSLGMPAKGVVRMRGLGTNVYHGRGWGGYGGMRLMLAGDSDIFGEANCTASNDNKGSLTDDPKYSENRRRAPLRGNMPADSGYSIANGYPFISVPVTISYNSPRDPGSDKTTMHFTGGSVTVELYSGRDSALTPANLVQTIHLKLPDADFPVPNLVTDLGKTAPTDTSYPAEAWWTFSRDGVGLPGAGQRGRLFFAEANPGETSANAAKVNHPGYGAFFREEVTPTIAHFGADVVATVVPKLGDFRLIAGASDIPETAYVPHDGYGAPGVYLAHSLREGNKNNIYANYDTSGSLVPGLAGSSYYCEVPPDVPSNILSPSVTDVAVTGDWDNGFGDVGDGAYINAPDGGGQYTQSVNDGAGPAFFSPNRQVSSAGLFGSLPTGIKSGTAFKTLLFHKNDKHPAASTTIPDHLFMDLFWMPVAEPYAISEAFSTAGKINMNYQLVPFTYIERSTALQAAARAERILGIPNSVAGTYKNAKTLTTNYRLRVNMGATSTGATGTLSQFAKRFTDSQKGFAFKSATEICDQYLVPEGKGVSDMETFWQTNGLTGDNTKERPYANLYQKLTTKSNTFTVHYRVQSLQKITNDAHQDEWHEGTDVVSSEYRGSSMIERYIDPNTVFPDFATAKTGDTMDAYYKWHVLAAKQFNP